MTKEEFIAALKDLNVEVTEEKLTELNKFYKLLVDWNRKINLTRIIEEQDVYLKHFYDSLTITKVVDLNEVIKELNLQNIEAIHSRGEDYQGSFDIVTSRAVANIEKLLTYTMHLVKKNGLFIAMKGNIDKEITPDIEKKISKKYQIVTINKFCLPKENSNRSLVVIKNK